MPEPPAEDPMRLAAMLDLTDAHGFAVLLGAWGSLAVALTTVANTPLIVVDPSDAVRGSPGISVVRCDGEIPLATGAARAVAVDLANTSRLDSAVRVTRSKGRVLAPASVVLPVGVRELARDGHAWVAEREPIASPIVTLHVRRG